MSTTEGISKIDTTCDKLERYVQLLEAIKAMSPDELKAVKGMLAVSRDMK